MLKKLLFIFFISSFIGNRSCYATELKKEDTLKINNLTTTGRDLIIKGDYIKADSFIGEALLFSQKINYKNGIYNAFLNKGVTFWYQENFPKSLDYLLKALKVAEELGNKLFISRALSNIGLVHASKSNYTEALDYYQRAMIIKKEIGDKKAVAILLSNMARIYGDMKNNKTALDYYYRSLEANKKVLDNDGLVALNYTGIGGIYKELGAYGEAKLYYTDALKISESMNDKMRISSTLVSIGALDLVQKDYKLAEQNLQKGLKMAIEIANVTNQRDAYQKLSELYENQSNWSLGLSNYRNYIKLQDSIFNSGNTKKMVQLEMSYEFDKKDAVLRSEQEKKAVLVAAEKRKQQVIIWSVFGILLLAIGFTVYVYKNYKEKQKINVEITKQKHIIEEKQKEILDSIYYAKRIQTALITSEKYIERNLNKLNNKL
ncbi:MAG: tetratricopeptide repeat protein [Bacteroidota bacterium]